MTWLPWLVAALMLMMIIANWWAAFKPNRKVFALTKVGALMLLVFSFLLSVQLSSSLVWFLLALIFSLGGDLLLLFPTRAFHWGLFSFLIAQVMYVIGFNQTQPKLVPFLIAVLFVLALFTITLVTLQKQVKKNSNLKRMRLAILVYVVMLSAMAVSAGLNLFKTDWRILAAISTTIGGVLFLTSDLMLAYDRFVQPIKHGHLLVMMTYHLAQLALIGGVILQFS